MGKLSSRRINRNKPTRAPAPLSVGENVSLTEGELKTLRELQQKLVALKVALADVTLQYEQIRQAQTEVAIAVTKQQEAIREQARAAIRAHGFDPEAKDRAWSVKIDDGVILRTA